MKDFLKGLYQEHDDGCWHPYGMVNFLKKISHALAS
jgi:hypothetical protein